MRKVGHNSSAKRGLVAFALEVEAAAVIRVLSNRDGLRLPSPRFCFPTTVHRSGWEWQMCVFGPGEAFSRHLTWHLQELAFKPDFALLAGFSGGLSPQSNTGFAFEVLEVRNPPQTPILVPPMGLAPSAASFHFTGLFSHPFDKAKCYQTTGCDLVDMESSYFSQTMKGSEIPFGILRTVSDGPKDALPVQAIHWVDTKGKLALGRLIRDVLRSPGLVRDLFRLAKASNTAGKNLGDLVLSAL